MQIEQLINDASGRADQLLRSAQGELAGAGAQLDSIYNSAGIATLDTSTAIRLPEIDSIEIATPPSFSEITLDTSGAPGEVPDLEFGNDPLAGLGDLPPFEAQLPLLNFPATPSTVSAFSGAAPNVDLNVVFPDAPDLLSNMIDAPTITDRPVPNAPEIIIPAFGSVAPADNINDVGDLKVELLNAKTYFSDQTVNACERRIDDMLYKMNPKYHDQMAKIETQLEKYLAGGSGFSEAVEDSIYERSKDKVNAEYLRTRDTAFNDSAKRGFTMPSGALFSAMMQARQQGADNNARASTDIAIKMAEIEQQNLQFAVTTSAGLRTTLLQAMLSYQQNLINIEGQALEGAKSVVNALVQTADIAIRIYSARLDAYKTEASVFVSRIQAASAVVEIYKAKISALEALTNVDMAKVSVYRARVDALNSVSQIYRTQVQTIIEKAQLERLKVDIFGAQVQAYSAMVQGKNAEIQGYAAAIGGEEAKVRVYSAQAQAYGARVSGYNAIVQAKATQVQATATRNRSLLDGYIAMNQAYSVKMSAEASRVGAASDLQRNLITEYAQANSAAIAKASASAEKYRLVSQVAMEEGRLKANNIQETARVRLATAQAVAQTSVGAAGVYANLSSAAMAGMNTLVTQTGEG